MLALIGLTGCLPTKGDRLSRAEQNGRTYYIDGAGNWGFGVVDVRDGLRLAGYQGEIVNFRWSSTLNPALDQTIGRPIAHLRGAALGRDISAYLRDYPNQEVNVIALSAGTGVAVWACEAVTPPAQVHNVILLGSSLSSTYDVTAALNNMSGRIYVYSSHADLILQGPIRTLGTIDGRFGVESAGLAGLRPPAGMEDRIVNVPWNSRYQRWGWTGSHVDATSTPFVRYVLAEHILPDAESSKLTSATDQRQ